MIRLIIFVKYLVLEDIYLFSILKEKNIMDIWKTPEEKKEELIEKISKLVTRYEMEVPAVLILESIKPLAWVGGAFAHMALGPFMLAFWEGGFDWIHTFEDMDNIENLIRRLEEKNKEEQEKKEKVQEKKVREDINIIDRLKDFLK
jgi:hypothetical protein